MRQIIYASCACSVRMYRHLFASVREKPGQQAQKYHRLFAEGFQKNGWHVTMITALPVNRQNFKSRFLRGCTEMERGVLYVYLPVWNIAVIKNIRVIIASFQKIRTKLKKEGAAYVLCDVLNQSVALGALLAAKCEKAPCIGIVTDLPDMLGGEKRMKTRVNRWVMRQYTGYIFLTAAMNEKVNKHNRPYVVLEGHVDCELTEEDSEVEAEAFVCLYSGALTYHNGLDILVEGFLMADLPRAKLYLYGSGDFVPKLKQICRQNKKIRYFGTCLNDDVVRAQRKASLLINPRPTSEEFTRYSFPSKNLEYMVSGTPVLTTRLAGIPEEYEPYVYFLEKESSGGMAEKLVELYQTDRNELKEKGRAARRFVLKNKSNQRQAFRAIKALMREI